MPVKKNGRIVETARTRQAEATIKLDGWLICLACPE